MSYHIININSEQCQLSCHNNQLICVSPQGKKTLPLEDIAALIITSYHAQITTHLISELGKRKIACILCECFKPTALVLPTNRASDTMLIRAQIDLPAQLKSRLWAKTINAKCHNQSVTLKALEAPLETLEKFNVLATGQSKTKESECARFYWQAYARILRSNQGFTRKRHAGGLNHLLNYGYAILLSTVLQRLYAIGIDPCFGIGHTTRERSAPLAYDLMEPFRPLFDLQIARWCLQLAHEELPDQMSAEYKRFIAKTLTCSLTNLDNPEKDSPSLLNELDESFRGFRHALLNSKSHFYSPWKQINTKWDGSL